MNEQSPRIPEEVIQQAYPQAQLTWVGAGGQSDVWRAQTADRGEVLRVLVSQEHARVENEISALREIKSPYLMRFYALETIRFRDVDFSVVRGEFIDGGTVADRIVEEAFPTEREILECALGVLEALTLLQEANLIHRDIKPQNVALRDGTWAQPVVLDLGCVRAVTATSVTVYPGRVGTLQYMAPEQLKGERAKMRSDVFALGLVLFELLTHERPFLRVGETVQIVDLIDRMEDTEWPQGAAVSLLPERSRGLVLSMLAGSTSDRPSVKRALREVKALLAERP